MKRRAPWLVFGLALSLVVAVMAGVSLRLVEAEHDRMAAEQRSALDEQLHLALWQLDSMATPLLMQEIAALGLLRGADDLDLIPPPPEQVRARFVLPADGGVRVSSRVKLDATRLDRILGPRTDAEGSDGQAEAERWAYLPEPVAGGGVLQLDNPVAEQSGRVGKDSYSSSLGRGAAADPQVQQARSAWELSKRAAAVDDNLVGYGSTVVNSLAATEAEGRYRSPDAAARGAVRPVWLDGELLLLRRVDAPNGEEIHGSWIDWPALREHLLAEVADVVPDAALVPVDAATAADLEGLLATLPVRLIAGPPPLPVDALGQLWPSLLLAWLGVLGAAAAVLVLLRRSLALSERRAEFVSAVTHELRTPLTTFRMYTEMLDHGMVDEHKRARYIATLRREADRLGELVENVLAYARIESERAPLTPESLTAATLVSRVEARLEERANAAELSLHVELPEELRDVELRVDPTAAGQVLFNLVDNAAKYGPSREHPQIELGARVEGRHVALVVRDHGPGVPEAERRAIFEPFSKAKAERSGAKPGVGLGLALSRRLARQLGGDLWVEDARPGARFVFTLPRA